MTYRHRRTYPGMMWNMHIWPSSDNHLTITQIIPQTCTVTLICLDQFELAFTFLMPALACTSSTLTDY
jgi:hypothetical protein